MIDPTQIQRRTTYSGQVGLSTLDGTIALQTGRGRLVVTEPGGQDELVVINKDGVSVDRGLVTLSRAGLKMNDGSNDRLLAGRDDGGF